MKGRFILIFHMLLAWSQLFLQGCVDAPSFESVHQRNPPPSFLQDLLFLEDESHNYTVDEAALALASQAQPFTKIHDAYSHSRFWYDLRVSASSSPWLLDISTRALSDLQIWTLQEGRWQPLACNLIPLSSHPRCLMNSHPEPQRFLIAMKFGDITAMNIHLDSIPSLQRDSPDETLLLNIFLIGISFALILYLGIFSWSFRNRNYLLFTLYAGSAVAYMGFSAGMVTVLRWPWQVNALMQYWGCFSMACCSLFAMVYLQTKTLTPVLHRLFQLILGVTVLQVCLDIFFRRPLFHLGYYLEGMSLTLIILAVSAAFRVRKAGIEGTTHYIAAWLVFAGFVVAVLAKQYGLWNTHSLFASVLLLLGSSLMLAILGLSVGKRTQMERQLLMKKLEESNNRLEEEVKQRTQQILDQQQMIIQSAKMASLGEMAGGVAHEINNPLAIISGYTFTLKEQVIKGRITPEQAEDFYSRIERATRRISSIVKSLRTISHEDVETELEVVSMESLVNDLTNLVSERFKNQQVDLQVHGPEQPLSVQGRMGQIEQILVNLLNNSFDAVVHNPPAWIRIDFEQTATLLKIHVTDSGAGIPPEIVNKIFDPFFTTKDVGKGTGLGLALSQRLAEGMDGKISYSLCKGHTRFTLSLTRIEQQSPRRALL